MAHFLPHALNLLFLGLLVSCTCYYLKPTLVNWDFSTDTALLAVVIGAATSAAALPLFAINWLCDSKCLGLLICLLVASNISCYVLWATKGSTSLVCEGAESTASRAGFDVSKYIDCDAEWLKYVLYVLIGVSGLLQICIALLSLGGCGVAIAGGVFAAAELGKSPYRRRPNGRGSATRGRTRVSRGWRGTMEKEEDEEAGALLLLGKTARAEEVEQVERDTASEASSSAEGMAFESEERRKSGEGEGRSREREGGGGRGGDEREKQLQAVGRH